MISGVLFDLDDTLFDHRTAARQALGAVRASHPALSAIPEADLEAQHSAILEELHGRVLTGDMGLDAARRERFRRLLASGGPAPDDQSITAAAAGYRDNYILSWCEVRGASALLQALRGRARVGIVSNNLAREQHEKLRACGLDRLVDVIVISEEVGVAKPDPAIFSTALDRLGVHRTEAVMIGDAWGTDIVGARRSGIRAIWFNPERRTCPDPTAGVQEIASLDPIAPVLSLIFGEERMGAEALAGAGHVPN